MNLRLRKRIAHQRSLGNPPCRLSAAPRSMKMGASCQHQCLIAQKSLVARWAAPPWDCHVAPAPRNDIEGVPLLCSLSMSLRAKRGNLRDGWDITRWAQPAGKPAGTASFSLPPRSQLVFLAAMTMWYDYVYRRALETGRQISRAAQMPMPHKTIERRQVAWFTIPILS